MCEMELFGESVCRVCDIVPREIIFAYTKCFTVPMLRDLCTCWR